MKGDQAMEFSTDSPRWHVNYLSTSALVRAMERAARELSTANQQRNVDRVGLWEAISRDLLAELASRQQRFTF